MGLCRTADADLDGPSRSLAWNLAIDSNNTKVYFTDVTGNSVQVCNIPPLGEQMPSSPFAVIPLGPPSPTIANAWDVAITPDGASVYVTISSQLRVVEISTTSNMVLDEISTGTSSPVGLVITRVPPPTCDDIEINSFTALPSQGTSLIVGVPVNFIFTLNVLPECFVQAQWDFDGSGGIVDLISNETNASYTYTQPGIYQARVEVFGINTPSATATTTVEVLTPAQAVPEAISKVQQLPLSSGNKNSLISKLTDAQNLITKGNINGACGKLKDFVSQMNTLVKTSRLSAQDAAPVLGQVGAIQTSLQCN
jgi:PKD repeat protein